MSCSIKVQFNWFEISNRSEYYLINKRVLVRLHLLLFIINHIVWIKIIEFKDYRFWC